MSEMDHELDLRLQRKLAELDDLDNESEFPQYRRKAELAKECQTLARHLGAMRPEAETEYHDVARYLGSVKKDQLDAWERDLGPKPSINWKGRFKNALLTLFAPSTPPARFDDLSIRSAHDRTKRRIHALREGGEDYGPI